MRVRTGFRRPLTGALGPCRLPDCRRHPTSGVGGWQVWGASAWNPRARRWRNLSSLSTCSHQSLIDRYRLRRSSSWRIPSSNRSARAARRFHAAASLLAARCALRPALLISSVSTCAPRRWPCAGWCRFRARRSPGISRCNRSFPRSRRDRSRQARAGRSPERVP